MILPVLKSPLVLWVKVIIRTIQKFRIGIDVYFVLGISNAVGLAAAEAHYAATFNRPGYELFDNYTYCILGDGCLQEGVSAEAISLAG